MNSKMAICMLCAVAVAIPTLSHADEAPTATSSETSTSAPAESTNWKQMYEDQKNLNEKLERRVSTLEEKTSKAPADSTDWKQMYGDQKKLNDELGKRLSILEEKDAATPYVKAEDIPESTLNFIKGVELNGFVSSSYTYNFNQPGDRLNGGQLYDTQHNEFMFNKFVLIAQHSVDYSPFDWKAGFFTELILGQDALSTRSKSTDVASGLFNLGDHGDLEQAYVQFNIPLGNGVKILFGKYVTPIGYELVENELNPNWTSGNQWTFLEPFTHTGLQIGYALNDVWELQLLVNQGWDTVKDNNDSKSFIGHVNYTPNDATWVGFSAFGGPEQSDFRNDPANAVPGANGLWRYGIDFAMTHQCTPKLMTAFQVDWGVEEGGDANGHSAAWYAFGLWLVYDWTDHVQTAFRADYMNDIDGNRTSGFLFPSNNHQDLWSLTLTLNYKPVEGLRIAPEIRYDHSSRETAFDGHEDQVLTSIAAVYSF